VDGNMIGELIERPLSGDQVAFEELVIPHRFELQVHCNGQYDIG
jgi:hypothetical protein